MLRGAAPTKLAKVHGPWRTLIETWNDDKTQLRKLTHSEAGVFLFCLPIPNQQDEEDRAHDQHDHDGREDDEAAGDEDVGVGHVNDGSSIANRSNANLFSMPRKPGRGGLKPGR